MCSHLMSCSLSHPPRQVVFCHAEVLCPELARQHQQCFMRVVASKGEEPLSACNVHVEAMKACLRQRGVYPFV